MAHIEIEPCQLCEAILDALRRRAKKELGPYDDKDYWISREIERIAENLTAEPKKSA